MLLRSVDVLGELQRQLDVLIQFGQDEWQLALRLLGLFGTEKAVKTKYRSQITKVAGGAGCRSLQSQSLSGSDASCEASQQLSEYSVSNLNPSIGTGNETIAKSIVCAWSPAIRSSGIPPKICT